MRRWIMSVDRCARMFERIQKGSTTSQTATEEIA